MKTKSFLGLCLIVCISVVFSARAEELQATDTASFAPVAVLKEAGFQFDPVIEGTVITHEFIFQDLNDDRCEFRAECFFNRHYILTMAVLNDNKPKIYY